MLPMSDVYPPPAASLEPYPRIWSFYHVQRNLADEEVAGFGIRSLAYLIDRVILHALRILFMIAGYAGSQAGSPFHSGAAATDHLVLLLVPVFLTMLAVEIAYYTYFHGHTGQTIGKHLCGLKVVDLQGHAIGYRRAFLRWVGYLLSFMVFGLGFLWVTIDRKGQSWHDKIAKSYVVRI